MSAPSIRAAKCGMRRVVAMAMAGLLLRDQCIAGVVPGPAAAIDDPDIGEAHLLQHRRTQRRLATCPAREEDLLAAILEIEVAARKVKVGLDVQLATRDVARAWMVPWWAISQASRTSMTMAPRPSIICLASTGLSSLTCARASCTRCRNVLPISRLYLSRAPRCVRFLWLRLLGRPASESGTLCHVDGDQGRRDRLRR